MDDQGRGAWQGRWLGGVLPIALVICVIAVLWQLSSSRQEYRSANPAWDVLTAIDKGDFNAVKRALDRGAPVDASEFGTTLLMRAASLRRVQMVELLLSRGADVQRADAFGTPLAYAAWNQDSGATVRLLLRSGADPNVGRRNGRTPLMLATSFGDVDAMAALIDAGASLDARDDNGESAMDAARANGESGASRLLRAATVGRGIPPEPRDGLASHFQPLELHRTASGS